MSARSPRLGRGDLRPRLGRPAGVGARAARAAARCAGDEVVLDAGCGSGRVTRCWPTGSRADASTASTWRRRWSSTPRGARRPRHDPVPGPGRARRCPSPWTSFLERDVPLDPRPRRAVRARCTAAMKPGGQAGGAVRRLREHRRVPHARGEVARRGTVRAVLRRLAGAVELRGPEATEARLRCAGFDEVILLARAEARESGRRPRIRSDGMSGPSSRSTARRPT